MPNNKLNTVFGRSSVDLYSFDFSCTYIVPREAIVHVPAQRLNITRLVACKNFSTAVAESNGVRMNDEQWSYEACKMGSRCKFVHVSQPLSNFPRQALHAHYIWRSLEDVTYERLWVGPEAEAPQIHIITTGSCQNQCAAYKPSCSAHYPTIKVLSGAMPLHERTVPGAVLLIDAIAALLRTPIQIPASRLLKTRGAESHLKALLEGEQLPPLLVCPSYSCDKDSECRLAGECPHAHVINLDHSLEVAFVRRSPRHLKHSSMVIEVAPPAAPPATHRKTGDLDGSSNLSEADANQGMAASLSTAIPALEAAAASPAPSDENGIIAKDEEGESATGTPVQPAPDAHPTTTPPTSRVCNDPYLKRYQKLLHEHGFVPMPHSTYDYTPPPGCKLSKAGKPRKAESPDVIM